jgi:hypothetical protein
MGSFPIVSGGNGSLSCLAFSGRGFCAQILLHTRRLPSTAPALRAPAGKASAHRVLYLVQWQHYSLSAKGSPSMLNQSATAQAPDGARTSVPSVQLKRQVTVKTMVTDKFREKAKSELSNELQLIDTQMQQLEAQYQHSLQQLEKVAQQGQNVQKQLQQLEADAQQKRTQLASLKMQVSSELGNIDKIPNGNFVITGILENFVELKVGDNIYEKLMNAEMIVEDGIVKSISV